MKLLKAKGDPIDFKYSSAVTIHISKEGVVVSDIVAQTALDRLAVTVEEASGDSEVVPEVIPGVTPSAEVVVDPAPDTVITP